MTFNQKPQLNPVQKRATFLYTIQAREICAGCKLFLEGDNLDCKHLSTAHCYCPLILDIDDQINSMFCKMEHKGGEQYLREHGTRKKNTTTFYDRRTLKKSQ